MSADVFEILICPNGQWRAIEDAHKYQFTVFSDGVEVKFAQDLKMVHPSVKKERCSTKKYGVFTKFPYVYIRPDIDVNASANFVVRENEWVGICIYFSDKTNWPSLTAKIDSLFKKYTGMAMTSIENITKAFESGVQTSKQTLEAKVEANELAEKKKIASICTGSVKKVKKTPVAKVTPQGGGRCNGF